MSGGFSEPPSKKEGGGTPKGAPWLVGAAACFPDRRKTEATETPSDVPPQRLKTPVRSSGDLADPLKRSLSTAFSRRSPVPVQPAHSGRPSYGPDGNPGPPESMLARHVPRRRISLRVAPPASSRSVQRRIASRKRPFTEQDTVSISEVLDPGIRNAKKIFREQLQLRAPDAAQRGALRGVMRC